jgi:hypothetical protein
MVPELAPEVELFAEDADAETETKASRISKQLNGYFSRSGIVALTGEWDAI